MNPLLELDPAKVPLSLYIHVPWCVKKCPYCDFNSHALPNANQGADDGMLTAPFAQYVDALIADAKSQQSFVQGRVIGSVFIGGGTPSLLPVAEFRRLFAALRDIYEFSDDCEITLEANPGTVEHAPFAEYLQIGINRLSIGVQTFDKQALKVLGRIHDPMQAVNAITQAKKAGFLRVNVDLMHGLPNQTAQLAVKDLQMAIDAGATHISWYQLTIEPNTAFYRTPPDLPNDETLDAIEDDGRALLKSHGFDNYEVSAWAGSQDAPCRHNLNYWQFGDYLAIGAGAHGKVTLRHHADFADGIYRFYKSRLPKDYLNFSPSSAPKMVSFEPIDEESLPFEFMMNALRLRHGATTQMFEERTGLLVSSIDNELLPLQHEGFMVHDATLLSPTEMGFRYVNHLVRQFL
ncbi:radical SAM family heme chaperone HemW [Moraxella nasibovis]|uniref:radical SAM family heme chaperone HemW n=1 Tax=Moraxella nasibovis TaxID=2904120 RepID=UPI00240FF560|nr:radical SAM family heme chaperone HemW [Moraxella nasibovis]WFF37893.1 radical SAM family heme chaperone HemW [Moraxella nasibovis]